MGIIVVLQCMPFHFVANFEEPPFHPCAMSQMLDRGDVFLMDRTNLKNPIRIAKHDESSMLHSIIIDL